MPFLQSTGMTSTVDLVADYSPARARERKSWQAWQRSDVKESSKHRRQRRQRAGDRILTRLAASCAHLQANRASQVSLPLRPLLQSHVDDEITMLALEGVQARVSKIRTAIDATLMSGWSEVKAADEAAAQKAAQTPATAMAETPATAIEETAEDCLDTVLTAKVRHLTSLGVVVDTDLVSGWHDGNEADHFRVVYDQGLPVTTTVRRDSREIAKLALGADVMLQRGDTPITVDGRIRAQIHAQTQSGSIQGWITMRSLDPSHHFVESIQRQQDDDDASEQIYELMVRSLSCASLGDASFETSAGLVVNVWVESADNSETELLALVRASASESQHEVAQAILKSVQLRLSTLAEPLHYQAMFENLSDSTLTAEELSAQERLRLIIFVQDPRDATLDFI